MPKSYDIRTVRQKLGFCGPASLEMMFSYYGINISQDEIAAAGDIVSGEDGSRIDQLDRAVKKLTPGYILLAKYNASIEDLAKLTEEYDLPVGIEWQGIFANPDGTYFEIGHYSVVISVDMNLGLLTILDPDERTGLINGRIFMTDFVGQWWEENDVPLPRDSKTEVIRNDRLLFVIAPETHLTEFVNLGLQPVSLDLMRTYRTPCREKMVKQDWRKKMKRHDKQIFKIPEENLTVHEVIGGSANHLGALVELHKEIFPHYGQYIPYMEERVKQAAGINHYSIDHWWLAEVNGHPAGFNIFKYMIDRNCGLCLLITVRELYRGKSFGGCRSLAELLLMSSLQQLKADASDYGRPTPAGMVLEVEHPKVVARFREFGFIELPVEYFEPPAIYGDKTFENVGASMDDFKQLHLGIFPIHGGPFNPDDPASIQNLALVYLIDHYHLPENHWAVHRALDSVDRHFGKGVA